MLVSNVTVVGTNLQRIYESYKVFPRTSKLNIFCELEVGS